jgi:hypothetical protein
MAKKVCPPGVWCFSSSTGVILVSILLFAVFVVILTKHSNLSTLLVLPQNRPSAPTILQGGGGGGDDRYTRAPEPLRFWQTGPDLRGAMVPPGAIPINVPTRGLPQAYQQMGIIKSGDKLLPLYGRQTAYRTDRYNYYTRTDTYNPVQLPVRFEKRDCMDSIGCNELLGGETVKISGMGTDGNVEVFKFDGPTYIPGLV